MGRFSGAGYAAEKAHENGFPLWASILIGVLVFLAMCCIFIHRDLQLNRNIGAQSALDQEAVSFITEEDQLR